MSIEVIYLRKKATHFQHLQIVGLTASLSGLVVMIVTHCLASILESLEAELWSKFEAYSMWSMALGSLIALSGLIVAIHYSKKLSEFINDWSRVMEELERTIREIKD